LNVFDGYRNAQSTLQTISVLCFYRISGGLSDYKLLRIFVYCKKSGVMKNLERITLNPDIMGGKPCIKGLRMTVGTIIGLLASGQTTEDVLKMYPYLQREDIMEALSYAAWRSEEIEVPLATV
jgi:uncharacterized protein (DUF433 family)